MAKKRAALTDGEIPTSKFENSEFDDLDIYLDDDFNHELYLGRKYVHQDFPELDDDYELDFFKRFYRALSYVKANLNRPLAVEKMLEGSGRSMKEALVSYANHIEHAALRDSRAIAHLEKVLATAELRLKDAAYAWFDAYEFEARADAEDDEYDPTKRGLTRQLAMMLLDDLFPNLKDATPNAKGEFIRLLVGFNAKGISNKWGDYNFDSQAYKDDIQTVAKWKRKLKIKE